ncbi:MAG: PLP-dependent aminotransferase family protein [Candidatus Zixiibacteriota bacterium]|nr:MAG: PLP-dependent aminotransferase family protein [candidate division Zixibacteria bacterium]
MIVSTKANGRAAQATGASVSEDRLASRTRRMSASAISEILKVASRPGVISLAGGLPAPESFPVAYAHELIEGALKKHGPSIFQYGPTEGFLPLREAIAGYLAERDVVAAADEVVITTGSQQTLDALGKVLISPGDKIAVESPTYLGAICGFNPYQPDYVALESDDDGVIPEALEQALEDHVIKFVYLIPNFQNPSGRTLSLARRKAIAAMARKHGALIIEDDPYRSLRYEGEHLPTLWSLAPELVVYAGTLSKVLSPGMRIGFCVAPPLIRRWIVLAKQGMDLHTSSLDQAIAAEYISGGYLKSHLPDIIALYRPRLGAMLDSLEESLPKNYSWSHPEGGMFLWLSGPAGLDTEKLYPLAVERNVAYVPGRYFFTTPGEGNNTARLNFSNVDEAAIRTGIEKLASLMLETTGR